MDRYLVYGRIYGRMGFNVYGYLWSYLWVLMFMGMNRLVRYIIRLGAVLVFREVYTGEGDRKYIFRRGEKGVFSGEKYISETLLHTFFSPYSLRGRRYFLSSFPSPLI